MTWKCAITLLVLVHWCTINKGNALRCYENECSTGLPGKTCGPPNVVTCGKVLGGIVDANRCVSIRVKTKIELLGKTIYSTLDQRNCSHSMACTPAMKELFCKNANISGGLQECQQVCCQGDLCNTGALPTSTPTPLPTIPPSDLYCSFDSNNKCGFHNEKTSLMDDFDWSFKGSYWSGKYGGGFASNGMVARLVSPRLRNVGCVRFSYMRSEGMPGSFDVFTHEVGSDSKNLNLVWSVSEGKESVWQSASIPIKTKKDIEIIFLSQHFISQDGVPGAIDNVNVTSASCTLQPLNMKDRIFTEDRGSCTFDKSKCGWKEVGNTTYWRRDTGSNFWNPHRDHTTKYGSYLYTRYQRARPGTKSQLVSPTLNGVKCLTFYYFMFSKNMGTLNIYKRIQGKDERIFQITGNQQRRWQKAIVPIKGPITNFSIVFESIRGKPRQLRDMCFDDISTYSSCEIKDYSCSFDNKTCGFFMPSSNNWKLVKTQTYGGGIKVRDHTTGKGSFLAPQPSYKPFVTLKSPAFPSGVKCAQFYFYRTLSTGSLDVLIQGGLGAPYLAWTVETGQAGWKFASIPINAKNNNSITLIFQTTGTPGAASNLPGSIDDIKVTSKSCTISPDQPRSRIFKEVQGSCNFEKSMCGYNKDKLGVWRRGSGSTMTMFTGPSYDHTIKMKSGYYVYAEATGIRAGTKSLFVSPDLHGKVRCATFYYHMFGSNIGELNVYERVNNGASGVDSRLFHLKGNQGTDWFKASVFFTKHKADGVFKLVFESVRGRGYKGDIAIDDISTSSNCTLPPTPTSNPAITPTTQAQNASVRLVNGPSKYAGRIEVLHNGIWGTICDDQWTIQNSRVVCRMLGFPGALTALQSYGSGSGTIWMDDVQCTGSETNIDQCRHAGWGVNSCTHSEDIGVDCQSDAKSPNNGSCSFEVNLCGYTDGDSMVSETNFIRRKGSTPSSFTGPSGDVSGKGYYVYLETSSGKTGDRAKLISPNLPSSIKCVSFYYNMRGSNIGTLNVYIKTNQTLQKRWTLSTEQGSRWLRGQLPVNTTGQLVFEAVRGNDYKGDIAIDQIVTSNMSCITLPANAKFAPDPNAREGDVRLAGSPSPLKGRVEIYHQGQWGTVCKDLWGSSDAMVVCRQLGFGSGRVKNVKDFGSGKGPIWLDNVECVGNEQSLTQCPKRPWGMHNCQHNKDAAVECFNGTDFECKGYRVLDTIDRSASYMAKGNKCDKYSGVFPGEWHRFQGPAGETMSENCIPVNRCSTHAPGWLDGKHPSVEEGMVRRKVCFHWSKNCCKWSTYIRVRNCSTFYVYELQKPPVCQLRYCGAESIEGPTAPPTPKPPKVRVRLAGSSTNYEGRVEVWNAGVWGTICNDYWDMREANIFCKQLGFTGATKATMRSGRVPAGIGKIWLDDLRCTGKEKNIWDCPHRGWGNENCGHGEDAGVSCISPDAYSCNFESDMCGYTTNEDGGWESLRWFKTGGTKELMDTTIGKSKTKQCLSGWSSYNGYCYFFKNRASRVTWHDAKRRCSNLNSWLVDIRTYDELRFIRSQRMSYVQQYHVGIREVNKTNVWSYLDGSIMNLTNVWSPGEPNNWNSNNEDCVSIDFRSSEGKFNDIPCGRAYGWTGLPNAYICKRLPTDVFGSFIGVDLSSKTTQGKITSLDSLAMSNITCLSFNFNTNGTSIDNMRVTLETKEIPPQKITVWQLEGNYGNKWKKAQIPFGFMGSLAFTIHFQVIHNSGQGKIFIDDILVNMNKTDSCVFSPQDAVPPTWKEKGSCNFETGTCGYTNVNDGTDELDWIKFSSHHMTMSERPLIDHTTHTGSYMMLSGGGPGLLTGHAGRLISPVLSPSQVKCMTFYWFFALKYTRDMELNVYLRATNSKKISDEVALWRVVVDDSTNPDLMGQWSKGVVPLTSNDDFQVIFEGIYNGMRETVSIDDIIMSKQTCDILPKNSKPSVKPLTKSGLRLAGATIDAAGRVEIFHQGRWGTVCGDVWSRANADVVCRQLGYTSALAAPCCGLFGKGSGRVWISNIRCPTKNAPASIGMCPHLGWGRNNCTHKQDAAVICNSPKTVGKDIKLRLSGGPTNMSGRVEVQYLGVWGTINDAGWDILDATVVCRQLKLGGPVGAYTGNPYGPGSGPVWFSGIGCRGNESGIAQCVNFKKLTDVKTDHKRDAGVECFDMRLSGGKSSKEGRVEINYQGKWGTVCNQNWNMKASDVVCRSLGYRRAKSTASFGKGTGDIHLSGVKCKGSEESISLCSHSTWKYHYCDHSQDVGVVCTNEQETKPVTPCSSNPCKNNGKCKEVKQSFTCQCSKNFTGQACETFIGTNVVGLLLKGDIKKWNPIKFKESIADILNKYCKDCDNTTVRTKRESEKFSSDNIIILEDPRQSSRSPPGYIYIEFVVVKTIKGKSIAVDPSKVRQTINKKGAEGIAGYGVVSSADVGQPSTEPPKEPNAHAQTGSKSSSNLALTIGFAVVLTILLAVILVIAMLCIMRRRKRPASGNVFLLKSPTNKSTSDKNTDNEVLITEDDNQYL